MVWYLRILLFSSEIPNKEAHGVVAIFNFFISPNFSIGRINQVFVCPSGIGIRHDHIGVQNITIFQGDARDFIVNNINFLNSTGITDRDAKTV